MGAFKRLVAYAMTRQKYLDYLRAFSAVCVIGIHTNGPFFLAPSVWSPTGIVGGVIDTTVRVGLPLFFMISGALLLAKPIDSVGHFYLRRFPKILIPFLLYSAAYYVYVHVLVKPSPISLGGFALAVVEEPQFYHLWFVYTLIGIYFIVPFISIAVGQMNNRMLWTGLFVSMALLQLRQLSPLAGLHFNGGLVAIGPWLLYFVGGYAITRLDGKRYRTTFLGLTALGFVATFFARALQLEIGIFDQGINMYALTFGVFGLFMGVKRYPAEGSIADRSISTIGKFSYEIYLVHAIVLAYLRDSVFRMGQDHPIRDTFLLTASVLLASLAIAMLVQTLITGPCVKAVNRLSHT